MALPGKRSKTRPTKPARLVKAQKEYVADKLSKRQAAYFKKLSPTRQRKYAEAKLSTGQLRTLRQKAQVRRTYELPPARHDAYGRARLTVEQRMQVTAEIRRLREKPSRQNVRKVQFLREQAKQGRAIRASRIEGYKQWRTIARGLKSKDNSPHGPKARALVLLGLRDPDWKWDVGDTPTGKGRRNVGGRGK